MVKRLTVNCDAEPSQDMIPKAKKLYADHPRVRLVYQVSRDLLCMHYKRAKEPFWKYTAELYIDSKFLFTFDPVWIEAVRTTRLGIFGKPESLPDPEVGLRDWINELDEERRRKLEDGVNKLAAQYGVVPGPELVQHLVFGNSTPKFPMVAFDAMPAGSEIAYSVSLKIFNAPVLRYLAARAPELFDRDLINILSDRLPYSPSDHALGSHLPTGASSSDEYQRIVKERSRLQAPMNPLVRIRTWACAYLNEDIDGPLNWDTSSLTPQEMWEALFPSEDGDVMEPTKARSEYDRNVRRIDRVRHFWGLKQQVYHTTQRSSATSEDEQSSGRGQG